MQAEIPPMFEQSTRASTNFWQKPFQVTDFLIPKSTCLMKIFILKYLEAAMWHLMKWASDYIEK